MRCPCGCDRSEQKVAELRDQEKDVALDGIAKALESIAERELLGYVTELLIVHRLRLLQLAEEIRNRNR